MQAFAHVLWLLAAAIFVTVASMRHCALTLPSLPHTTTTRNTEIAWKCKSTAHDPHKGRYRQEVVYKPTTYLSKSGKEIPDTWGKVHFCDISTRENKKYGKRNFWALETYEMTTIGGVDKVSAACGGRVAIAFSEALDPSEIEPNAWIECPNEQRYVPYLNDTKAGGVPKFHFFDPPWT